MKNICFIICYNDELLLSESKLYIERLYLPEGYGVDIITVSEADSMCSAYNAAMRESSAEIKVYLHQDTFIVNRYFLYNLIDIFEISPLIGMIGMVGTPRLPDSAIMWAGSRFGKSPVGEETEYIDERIDENSSLYESAAIDGFLIATSVDITWREDIFDGFDFYDISQAFEYRRKGYFVYTPEQRMPWCIHSDGKAVNLGNYNAARKKFLEEYKKEEFCLNSYEEYDNALEIIFEEQLSEFENNKSEYRLRKKSFKEEVDRAIASKDYQKIITLYGDFERGRAENDFLNPADYVRFGEIVKIMEKECSRGKVIFTSDVDSFDELIRKFRKIELYLRRFEFDFNDEIYEEVREYICLGTVSDFAIEIILDSEVAGLGNKNRIRERVYKYDGK